MGQENKSNEHGGAVKIELVLARQLTFYSQFSLAN